MNYKAPCGNAAVPKAAKRRGVLELARGPKSPCEGLRGQAVVHISLFIPIVSRAFGFRRKRRGQACDRDGCES